MFLATPLQLLIVSQDRKDIENVAHSVRIEEEGVFSGREAYIRSFTVEQYW